MKARINNNVFVTLYGKSPNINVTTKAIIATIKESPSGIMLKSSCFFLLYTDPAYKNNKPTKREITPTTLICSRPILRELLMLIISEG
jgi:hypothetical protein